jgi:hypothetical protein
LFVSNSPITSFLRGPPLRDFFYAICFPSTTLGPDLIKKRVPYVDLSPSNPILTLTIPPTPKLYSNFLILLFHLPGIILSASSTTFAFKKLQVLT